MKSLFDVHFSSLMTMKMNHIPKQKMQRPLKIIIHTLVYQFKKYICNQKLLLLDHFQDSDSGNKTNL